MTDEKSSDLYSKLYENFMKLQRWAQAEEKLNLNVEQMMDFFNNLIIYIEKEITETFGGTLNAKLV